MTLGNVERSMPARDIKLLLRALSVCTLGLVVAWNGSRALGEAPVRTAAKSERSLEEVAGQLATNDPDLRRSLSEALRQHPQWTEDAAVLLGRWLADPKTAESHETELTGILRIFGHRSLIERQVADKLASQSSRSTLLLLLRIFARLGSGLPALWKDGIRRALEDRDLEVVHEALIAARACELRKVDAKVRSLSSDALLPGRLRVAAFACLAWETERLDAEAFSFLREQISETENPVLRIDAARLLGTTRWDEKQLLELCGILQEAPATPGLLFLEAFRKSRGRTIGLSAVKALDDAPAAELLTVGALDRLFANYPEEVQESAKPLRERLLSREKPQFERLAAITSELLPGDPDRGLEVFFSQKAACNTCHGVAGKGGGWGPSLSRIAFIRTRSDLLKSILSPSAVIDPEFRNWIIQTESGQVFTGLLSQECSAAVYLRSGTESRLRVPVLEIEEMRISGQSLMPQGYEKLMTRQELSDLVEFLSQQD